MVETVVSRTNPDIFMDKLPEWRFRKTVRYGSEGSALTHMFDQHAFLQRCQLHIDNGLASIGAKHPDPLAVMLRFFAERVSHAPSHSMAAMEAYRSYKDWARAHGASPMAAIVFTSNLRNFVELACKDRVRNEPKVGATENYVGLALL